MTCILIGSLSIVFNLILINATCKWTFRMSFLSLQGRILPSVIRPCYESLLVHCILFFSDCLTSLMRYSGPLGEFVFSISVLKKYDDLGGWCFVGMEVHHKTFVKDLIKYDLIADDGKGPVCMAGKPLSSLLEVFWDDLISLHYSSRGDKTSQIL